VTTVYAPHENPGWFPPFARAFEAEGAEVIEWLLTDGVLDLDSVPPEGIFWSRISASAHTRDHGRFKDYARCVHSWLEAHGRRTVNGRRVLELEMSKVDQLTALRAAGIETPRIVAAVGPNHRRQVRLRDQGGHGPRRIPAVPCGRLRDRPRKPENPSCPRRDDRPRARPAAVQPPRGF